MEASSLPYDSIFVSDQRILVVDDENYNLDAIQLLLEVAMKRLGCNQHVEIVKQLVDYAMDGY